MSFGSQDLKYVDNQPYLGKIVDQSLLNTKNSGWMVKFTVGLSGKVTNTTKPEEGAEAVRYEEIDTLVSLNTSDPDKFAWRLNDLRKLGLEGDDISVVDPGHEKHQSFIGKTIIVAPTIKDTDSGVKTYWNLVFKKEQKRLDPKDLDQANKALSKHIENANKRLANRNKAKAEPAGVPF